MCIQIIQIFYGEITFFLKNYITSEGAFCHNVLFYQPLSIAHYQVSFYGNNYWRGFLFIELLINLYVFLYVYMSVFSNVFNF